MVLAMAALYSAAFSQGFFYGPHAGVQSTSFKWTDDFQDEFTSYFPTNYQRVNKLGFHAGARVGLALGDQVALLSDLSFERSTFAYDTENNYLYETEIGSTDTLLNGLVRFEKQANRLSVPLLARVQVNRGLAGLTLLAGPSFSLGLSGKQSAVFDTGNKTYPLEGAAGFTMGGSRFDEYRQLDVGMIIGIGGAAWLSEQVRLTFDVRRRWGFTSQYSEARKNFLSEVEGVDILGSKFLRGTYFTLGVEVSSGTF